MVALNEARTTQVMSPVSLLLYLIWIVFVCGLSRPELPDTPEVLA